MSTLLLLAPFLLALVTLALGRYPGEQRIRELGARARHPRPHSAPRARLPLTAMLPRGRRLLAASLAGRAPPQGARL